MAYRKTRGQIKVKPRRRSFIRRLLNKFHRVTGTVYVIRCRRDKRRWWQRPTYTGYVGKYAGPWEERIRQHLYGGGQYDCEPKPWADLVPGYVLNVRGRKAQLRVVDAVIAAGGASIVWQEDCFYWYLRVRELWSITRLLPVHNIQDNLSNSRHMPKWEAEAARARRDAGIAEENAAVIGGVRWPVVNGEVKVGGRPQWYGRNYGKVG